MHTDEIGFIDENGNYYEGENKGNDLEVKKRPSPFHNYVGKKWVLNPETEAAYNLEQTNLARQAAYAAESDALFFKEQRGEVPEGTWLAKVAEIKERFPK